MTVECFFDYINIVIKIASYVIRNSLHHFGYIWPSVRFISSHLVHSYIHVQLDKFKYSMNAW